MIFQIRVKIVNKHFLLLPSFRLTEKVFNVKRKKRCVQIVLLTKLFLGPNPLLMLLFCPFPNFSTASAECKTASPTNIRLLLTSQPGNQRRENGLVC